jgi:hypothetical protein
MVKYPCTGEPMQLPRMEVFSSLEGSLNTTLSTRVTVHEDEYVESSVLGIYVR